jgi:hypothetical protein
MLTVVWNTRGFHLIDVMPRGEKFSARYFIDKNLTPICAQLIPTGRHKLVIHADNSQCHNAKVVLDFMSQNQAKSAPHLPYSPDLPPSDFSFLVISNENPEAPFFRPLTSYSVQYAGYRMISHLRGYVIFSTNRLTVANKSSQQKGITLRKNTCTLSLCSNSAQPGSYCI